MSAKDIRQQIKQIQTNIKDRMYGHQRITYLFQSDVNLLQRMYGEYLGTAKARHQEHLKEFSTFDNDVRKYFEQLVELESPLYCFSTINLAIGKISELVSFVEAIESAPAEEKVTRASYIKLLREKEDAERTAKFLVQYTGLPELHTLLEISKNIGIAVDEYWVLALCSSNLIEAVVNKKLKELGAKVEGSFKQKYRKLGAVIKEKEGKDISQLLPLALYDGIRNKLDHASDANRVTPKEAKDISEWVIKFMKEIFP